MFKKAILLLITFVIGSWIVSGQKSAEAAETGFSVYPLGGTAFGAGVTPPPGTYISFAGGFYTGRIDGAVTVGGELLDVGLDVDILQATVNGTHVLNSTVLGGRPAISVTIPTGYVGLEAGVSVAGLSGTREVHGFGLGDISGRLQLGWEHGDFSHLVYIQGVAPTGRYDVGFEPNVGLNRPSVDVGWAFTWTEKTSKLQFNGALGFTFNAENDETGYDTGNEFHFEWAVGREAAQGLVVGIVGYNYRQISADSGSGAVLGPFEGEVDAIGAGLSYTTLVNTTPFVVNLRHYQEFNAGRRWDGSMTIFSGTTRF